MKKNTFFLILIFLISVSNIFSQSAAEDIGFGNIDGMFSKPSSYSIKPSEGKYVDMFTGRANYNISIYNLKEKDISVPISLSYSSAGVNIGSIAGWTGMEWDLFTGGEITREVKGLPDETPNKGFYYYQSKINNFDDNSQTAEEKKDMILQAEKNEIDLQPDIFYISTPSYSGKFTIDCYGNFLFMPYAKFLTKKTIVDNKIIGFEITDSNGVIYKFGYDENSFEETKFTSFSAKIEFNDWNWVYDHQLQLPTVTHPAYYVKELKENDPFNSFYTSKWYVTKIESPIGANINFKYSDVGLVKYVNAAQNTKYGVACFDAQRYDEEENTTIYFVGKVNYKFDQGLEDRIEWDDYPSEETVSVKFRDAIIYYLNQSMIQVKRKVLNEISTSSGSKLVFFRSNTRQDIVNDVNLDHIELYYKSTVPIKKFYFGYKNVESENKDVTGNKLDPFTLMECFNLKELNLPYSNNNSIPAFVATNYLKNASGEGLINNYVYEGLKEYNYNRLFLQSYYEKSGNDITNSYTFEYLSPEKLQRRTSGWTDGWGYNGGANSLGQYTNSNGKKMQCSDLGFSRPAASSKYGLLSSVKTPLGSTVSYQYENNSGDVGSRVSGINITDQGKNEVSLSYMYGNTMFTPGYSGGSVHYYYKDPDHNSASEDKFTIANKFFFTSNFSYMEPMTYKGSLIGYKSVQEKTINKNDLTKNNGTIAYTFFEPKVLNDQATLQAYTRLKNDWISEYCWMNSSPRVWRRDVEYVFYPESNKNQFPYPPDTDNSYLHGNLENIQYLNPEGKCIKKVEYKYDISEKTGSINIRSLKCYSRALRKFSKETSDGTFCGFAYKENGKFLAGRTDFKTGLIKTSEIKEITYNSLAPDDLSKAVISKSNFLYNSDNGLLLEKTQTQSDEAIILTKYTYPTDISFADHPSSCYDYTNTAEAEYNERRNYCYSTYSTDNDRMNCMNTVLAPKYAPSCYNPATGEFLRQSCIENCSLTPLTPEANAIQSMVFKNIINTPVQVITKKGDDIIGANYTSFNVENGLVLPKVSNTIEIKDPISSTTAINVNFSGQLVTDLPYVPNAYYDTYDNKGNLLQYHEAENINTSIIWGYNKTLPLAKVINAQSNQIAYTSFEDNTDYGNWQLGGGTVNANIPAKTGKKYMDMYSTNVLQYTFAVAGKYKLEYWSTTPVTFSSNSQLTIRDISTSGADANGWVLYIKEITVAAPTTLGFGASSAKIDEVRLYPAAAQMTTYTYDPLIGMTSETNEKNIITYYEYDPFGRLSVVRDQDRNIIKTYDYHYKE